MNLVRGNIELVSGKAKSCRHIFVAGTLAIGMVMTQVGSAEAISAKYSASYAISQGAWKIAAPVKTKGAKAKTSFAMQESTVKPFLNWLSGGHARLSALLHDGARSVNPVVAADPLTIKDRQGSIPAREEAALVGLEAHMDVQRLQNILSVAQDYSQKQKKVTGKHSPVMAQRIQALKTLLAEAKGRYRRIAKDKPDSQKYTISSGALPLHRDQAIELALKASPAWNSANNSSPQADAYGNASDARVVFDVARSPTTEFGRAQGRTGFGGKLAVKVGFQSYSVEDTNEAQLAPNPIINSLKVKRRVQQVIFDRVNVAYDALWAADLHEPLLSYQSQRHQQLAQRFANQGKKQAQAFLKASDQAFAHTAALINLRFGRDFANYQILAVTGRLVTEIFKGNPRPKNPAVAQARE